MRYSQSDSVTSKEAPKEAEAISHQLLLRGSFIHSLGSGFYALLPLGFRVWEKIYFIIQEELNKIGVEDVRMTVVMPAKTWKESGRFFELGPELWRIKNRFEEDFVLGLTHEEVFADAAKKVIFSYKDLPKKIGQIHTKVRDEARARGGLLRTREFTMQDAYSFDQDEAGLKESYALFAKAYGEIFKKIGIETIKVESEAGAMGGLFAEEFIMLSPAGEDRVVICQKCDYAVNAQKLGLAKEEFPDEKIKFSCPKCQAEDFVIKRGIEVGNIFQLGTKYSEKQKLYFKDARNKEQPVWMGSYGIGLERLMASIVEASHDAKGIVWPEAVAPYDVYLFPVGEDENIYQVTDKIYEELQGKGVAVLYDDRRDFSAGEKFADADLLGIPNRLVVSEKTLNEKKVELTIRKSGSSQMVELKKITSYF